MLIDTGLPSIRVQGSLKKEGEISMCGPNTRNVFLGAALTCRLSGQRWFSTAQIIENPKGSAERAFPLIWRETEAELRKELNSVGQQVGAATKGPFLALLESWGLHSQRTLAPGSFVQPIPGLPRQDNEASLTGGFETQWKGSSVHGNPHGQESVQ